MLIKDKRGHAFNLEDDLVSFYQSIKKNESSYFKKKDKKPIQEGFNF